MMSAVSSLGRPETKLTFRFCRTLPVVLQTEEAECGLACLAMVAGFHGHKTDLTSLRHLYPISAHGATLKQIMDFSQHMGLAPRALRLELADITKLQVPCILHWEMKHFVVLKKASRKGLVIHDPAVGQRYVSVEDAADQFTGVALELSPTQEFEQGEQSQKLSIRHFWTQITGLRRSLILVLILSLCLQLFAIVSPYFVQIVVDDVILRADVNLLKILALGFLLLLFIELATQYIRQYVILNLSSKLNVQMAANVFRHLIRLPLGYFSKRHIGDLVSRFGSLTTIRELLTTGLVAVVVDGLMAVITLIVMFWYNTQLTFIVLAVVFLYATLRYLLYRPLRILNEEHINAAAKENSHFIESMRAIQSIKLFEKETDRQNQWHNCLTDSLNKDIRISRWRIGFDTANRFLFGIENIAIIYCAAIAVTNNLLTVGMLYAFISYKSRFISAMDQLIAKWIEFKMLDLHFDRLSDIVFTPKDPALIENDLIREPTQAEAVRGHITIQNLCFSFDGCDAPLFHNLNLNVCAGETVAIVGPSGSGKSTLLKCIMGLFSYQSGSIMIDGQAIANWRSYRQQIAAVMQDDQLLSGNIADNIACFDVEVDFHRVTKCALLACIHDEIMQMSMQYNTLVGDMGTNLSGGQKQRLLLARALYKQPRILFMDEATSHLDTANERHINQHIKDLSITRVIIAHRPDTIAMADKVYQLVSGRLALFNDAVKPETSNTEI